MFDISHADVRAQLLLQHLLQPGRVIAEADTPLGEDLLLQLEEEVAELAEGHLPVDEREGQDPTRTAADDPVKQLRDPPPCQPLDLAEDVDLDERPDPAPVQTQDAAAAHTPDHGVRGC